MIRLWLHWSVNFGGGRSNLTRLSVGSGTQNIVIVLQLLIPFTSRCFPHIVNLACKAVLAAITNLDYVAETAEDFVPLNFLGGLDRDPIATIRSLIHAVCVCFAFLCHNLPFDATLIDSRYGHLLCADNIFRLCLRD
jgi:hypothetical protein